MKPCVFIHTNARQRLGALVARHALQRNSQRPELFDVRLNLSDTPMTQARLIAKMEHNRAKWY